MCRGFERPVMGFLRLHAASAVPSFSLFPRLSQQVFCLDIPDVHSQYEQRRNFHRLPIEDGGCYPSAAPFYLFLVLGYALPGGHHVVHDDDVFPFYIAGDAIVPFEDTFFAAFYLMQAFACSGYHHIVQPRGHLRAMRGYVLVQTAEAADVFLTAAARHEHDMQVFLLQMQGFHAGFEESHSVDFTVLESEQRMAEHPLPAA